MIVSVFDRVENIVGKPGDKILDWSKFKASADDKILTQKLKFVTGRIENMREKKKMLVTSIFSFSHNVFTNFLLGLCGNWFIKTALN